MPRARARNIVTLAAFTFGLGACSTSPAPHSPASGAAAIPRTDTRPDAAPLLTHVLNQISEQGSARNTVHGNLGLIGELTGESAVHYQEHNMDVSLKGYTRASKSQPPQRVQVSIVDGTGYLKSPMVPVESGKHWLKVTPVGSDFTAKLLSPALSQLQNSTDPRATFRGIEAAAKIASSAPETIDGVATTRYDLQVLTERAAQLTPDPQQRTQLKRAADEGIGEMGYRLWLDRNGLPVRFAANQEVAQAGRVSLTSTYRDWGVPTKVQAPPGELVGAMRDLPTPLAHQPG